MQNLQEDLIRSQWSQREKMQDAENLSAAIKQKEFKELLKEHHVESRGMEMRPGKPCKGELLSSQ